MSTETSVFAGKALKDDSDDEVYDAKQEALRLKGKEALEKRRNLIGGQAPDANEDVYMTTSQRQANGIPDLRRKAKTKKLQRSTAYEISPITGEKICDFGTWASEFEAKQKGTLKTRVYSFVPSDADLRTVKLLSEQLRARGSKAFIGLQRKFRIMDDDRSGSLDIEEFKKGIKECGFLLTGM